MTTDDNTINDNIDISQLSEYQRRVLDELMYSGDRHRVTIALTTEQTAGQFIGGTSRILRQLIGGTFVTTTNRRAAEQPDNE